MNYQLLANLENWLGQQIVGQQDLIHKLMLALLADGHLLVEGAPGLAKTRAIKEMAEGIEGSFHRIQFTPDLLPGDITGTDIFRPQTGAFEFQQGPIFNNLVLADEINRAPAKVQSALLEARQERSVTVAGTTHELPNPFHVIATQNPIELEGTFPLPEAQLDRFLFRLDVRTPDSDSMARVLEATTGTVDHGPLQQLAGSDLLQLQGLVREVLCGSHLLRHVAELVIATHPDNPETDDDTKRFVRYGASARAGQAILLGAKARALLAGRPAVVQTDVDACLLPALRHRVLLGFEADAEQVTVADLLPQWQERAARAAR